MLVSKRNPDSGLYRFESLQFTDFQSFQLYADRLTVENEHSAHAQKSELSAKSASVATYIVIHTMLAALSTPKWGTCSQTPHHERELESELASLWRAFFWVSTC